MTLDVVIQTCFCETVEGALIALELYLVCMTVIDMYFEIISSAGAVIAVGTSVDFGWGGIESNYLRLLLLLRNFLQLRPKNGFNCLG